MLSRSVYIARTPTFWSYDYLLYRNLSCSQVVLDKKEKESKLQGFAMTSYMKYMKHYEQKLEKRFPSAMQAYRIFSDGIKKFYNDLKMFFKIRYILLGNEEELNVLSRREIELYDQMPKDMLKVAPVILLSALPFANYIVLPITYMYPYKFLSSQFWTAEQKEVYNKKVLKERVKHNIVILKSLKQCTDIKTHNLHGKWCDIMELLENGSNPSVEQIIECRSLFITGPYCLKNLNFHHVTNLLHMHGISAYLHRRNKLIQRAFILKEMDSAIVREGGVKKLDEDTLMLLCNIRGLYATKLTSQEKIAWLQKWLNLSNIVERESFSLLLHAPLLLGCNHHSNINLLKQ